tara:strand:+ start:3073 stop:3966 length:894 start_codon:yes stop_codon:yes gene_type:complete
MLPRRHIRIKIFQSLYASTYHIEKNEYDTKQKIQQNLDGYLKLYYLIIDLFIILKDVAKEEITIKKNKLRPSQEDLKPNTRFVNNYILKKLKKLKNNDNDIENEKKELLIKKVFKLIKTSKTYINYMIKTSPSKKDDKNIIIHILKKYFVGNETIHDFLEEYSIYWNDDILIVYNSLIEKINNNLSLNSVQLFRKKEDQLYANSLIQNTLSKKEEINLIIYKLAKNWDQERIAISDLIIMRMAISEMLYIKNIPNKVTLDEYIEIAKEYSSPKSKEFVNGILDVFIKDILVKSTSKS